MQHTTRDIQTQMFGQEKQLKKMAAVFESLSSDCRLEIIYLLSKIETISSGDIARLTNCTPSQVSQYLARLYDAGVVQKRRTWRTVEYSLDRRDPFVTQIIGTLVANFDR